MGMASSDNDAQIMRDHARNQAYRDRPRNPNTWEQRASDESMARYHNDLANWAESLPEDPDPYWNDRR